MINYFIIGFEKFKWLDATWKWNLCLCSTSSNNRNYCFFVRILKDKKDYEC